MAILNLVSLDDGRFEELCQSLLIEEFQRFQAFSSPDAGMDGYDSDTATIYQVYFPEREPNKSKIRADLLKARSHGHSCKRWVLLLPKNPTPALLEWLRKHEQPICNFSIEVWGKNEILRLLRRHSLVKQQFFPSEVREEVRRLAKGKKPATGDADNGGALSVGEAQELHDLITELAEGEAARKRRRVRSSDFQREYGEFNAHFRLSSYDRLPHNEFANGRSYLEAKLYARRGRDSKMRSRQRIVGGIKAIQKELGIGESEYRELLFNTSGKRSTSDMDNAELHRVLELFRHKQGLATAH
jgi:hypothetical protein